MTDDGGGSTGADGRRAAAANGVADAATDAADAASSADAPPPPPGVPDATEIGADVLRGDADGLEERVDDLHDVAQDAREAFEPPEDAAERALAYCRHGLWPVLAVYVDRRGAGAALGQPHHDRLEVALNTWLELYARSYGGDHSFDFSVREAAELFVSTHNVLDVAQLLTDVPER
ncbi:hypothetical protein L593_07670 [Salinarchaeum sp. Harcht-Bsk1]|uniref:hypothetical protein n=1 Tax=Salinarchaeum sp. Harcht-Bsk1 TaxID=1333523 RepID=UPI0003424586|nr:hypothetical protein [Salinarchaeum sp. Harcht-Bsk1]AGN01479.1 hypothetical protein L593_07670 [Salinarchaeum sp. Harcht-Bsk1]